MKIIFYPCPKNILQEMCKLFKKEYSSIKIREKHVNSYENYFYHEKGKVSVEIDFQKKHYHTFPQIQSSRKFNISTFSLHW